MSLSNPSIRVVSLFLIFGVFALRVRAQIATCSSNWGWANNSQLQTPCEVASALNAYCEGGIFSVLGPLKQGSSYPPPQKNDQAGQKCNCNLPVYSLYMACTACQNVTTQSWAYWSENCSSVYVDIYPGNIPTNIPVPRWAFLNYTATGKFDPTIAQAVGRTPEVFGENQTVSSFPSSSTSSPPKTSSTHTTSLTRTSTRPSSLTTNSGSPPSTTVGSPGQGGNNRVSKSTTGAIAGGVVGGFAALAAIGVGTLILLRKRAAARRDRDYSDDVGVYDNGFPVSARESQPLQQRLYDPSDPSTYPTTSVDVGYRSSGPYGTPPINPNYTGAAEL